MYVRYVDFWNAYFPSFLSILSPTLRTREQCHLIGADPPFPVSRTPLTAFPNLNDRLWSDVRQDIFRSKRLRF